MHVMCDVCDVCDIKQVHSIEYRLRQLKEKGEKALIPFITAGDPDLTATKELVPVLEEAGADVVELGVPFSDPLADGPVIQRASQRALAGGVTLEKILRAVQEIKKCTRVPLVLMTYYNPVYQYGLNDFCHAAAEVGVEGLIVPDLPYEEAGELKESAEEGGLALIQLVAPTSTERRVSAIASSAQGFIYCVSVTGVTGSKIKIKDDLLILIERVRKYSELPVGVGFGISTPQQAAKMARYCDAVIIGSAIVKIIEKNYKKDLSFLLKEVGGFVKDVKKAL